MANTKRAPKKAGKGTSSKPEPEDLKIPEPTKRRQPKKNKATREDEKPAKRARRTYVPLEQEAPVTSRKAVRKHLLGMFRDCASRGEDHTRNGPDEPGQYFAPAPVKMCYYWAKHQIGIKVQTNEQGSDAFHQPYYLSMPTVCYCSLVWCAKQIVTRPLL